MTPRPWELGETRRVALGLTCQRCRRLGAFDAHDAKSARGWARRGGWMLAKDGWLCPTCSGRRVTYPELPQISLTSSETDRLTWALSQLLTADTDPLYHKLLAHGHAIEEFWRLTFANKHDGGEEEVPV